MDSNFVFVWKLIFANLFCQKQQQQPQQQQQQREGKKMNPSQLKSSAVESQALKRTPTFCLLEFEKKGFFANVRLNKQHKIKLNC